MEKEIKITMLPGFTLTVEPTPENMRALCSIASETICAKDIIEDGNWSEELVKAVCANLKTFNREVYRELDSLGYYDKVKAGAKK